MNLDNIKASLERNNNITKEIKDNIFELVVIFNHNFPNVNLDGLMNRLSTLKIARSSRFISDDVSRYDIKENTLYLNIYQMKKNYDMRHIFMFELLNIITCNGKCVGFASSDIFNALNRGYTEIMANFLVGNNGEELVFPKEAIMANMISIIVGDDNMKQCYFNNSAELLLSYLEKAGVDL